MIIIIIIIIIINFGFYHYYLAVMKSDIWRAMRSAHELHVHDKLRWLFSNCVNINNISSSRTVEAAPVIVILVLVILQWSLSTKLRPPGGGGFEFCRDNWRVKCRVDSRVNYRVRVELTAGERNGGPPAAAASRVFCSPTSGRGWADVSLQDSGQYKWYYCCCCCCCCCCCYCYCYVGAAATPIPARRGSALRRLSDSL